MPLDFKDPKVRVAVFGEQVKQFMDSDIGQYVLQCAQADTDHAARQLMDLDPTDTAQVIAIQIKLKVAASIESWLTQAISAGLQAFHAEELE
jgi:hypothetical protein